MEDTSFFVGWGTLALSNTATAGALNRHRLTWFLISIIFGPIATFLLAIMGKVDEADE